MGAIEKILLALFKSCVILQLRSKSTVWLHSVNPAGGARELRQSAPGFLVYSASICVVCANRIASGEDVQSTFDHATIMLEANDLGRVLRSGRVIGTA